MKRSFRRRGVDKNKLKIKVKFSFISHIYRINHQYSNSGMGARRGGGLQGLHRTATCSSNVGATKILSKIFGCQIISKQKSYKSSPCMVIKIRESTVRQFCIHFIEGIPGCKRLLNLCTEITLCFYSSRCIHFWLTILKIKCAFADTCYQSHSCFKVLFNCSEVNTILKPGL